MNCAATERGQDRVVYSGRAGEGKAEAVQVAGMKRVPSVGSIVRAYKAASTRMIRDAGHPAFGWQPNYYEHVIRNDRDLDRIREYVVNNPLKWDLDHENPDVMGMSAPAG